MRYLMSIGVLVGAAALGACATPPPAAPAPPPATAIANSNASAKVAATDEEKTPDGYQRVEFSDGIRYCKTEVETSSRVKKTRTCFTAAELKDMENNTQSFIQNAQSHGTQTTSQSTPGMGGAK